MGAPQQPVQAAGASEGGESCSFSTTIQDYADVTKPADVAVASELLALAADEVAATSSGLELNTAAAFAVAFEDGTEMLRVPFVATEDVLEFSGLSVFFDADRQITDTGEVVFTELSADSGRMQMWQGGELVFDQEATDPPAAEAGTMQTVFNWGTLNQCLLDAGVSQWAITIIGTGCALLCGATAGTGCIVCIVGIAGIAGTTVGTCVARAMVS